LTLSLLLAACGGDSGPAAPEVTYDRIAGSYAGGVAGVSQGVTLSGTFTLSLTQNDGTLGGTYAISGQLSDGFDVVGIQGTGALSGTIAPGDNPSVNLTVTPGSCSNRRASFSGAYDSTNRRLTLSGPLEIFRDDCTVALTYPSTIILER
jgi:hypothetical protein